MTLDAPRLGARLLAIAALAACSDERAPGPGSQAAAPGEGGEGHPSQGEGEGEAPPPPETPPVGEGEGEGEGEPRCPEGARWADGECHPGQGGAPATGGAAEVAPAAINFGFLADGVEASRVFEVRSVGGAAVTVEEVSLTWDSSDDFALTGGPELPTQVLPGEAASFVVSYTQSGEEGDLGAVWIRTDSADTPDLSVRLLARRKEGPQDIHVEPPALDYGRRAVGGPATAAVDILNVGGLPLAVRDLRFDPPGGPFTLGEPAAPFDLGAGDSTRVQVVFTPPAPGDFAGDLVIASDDPNEAEVRVDLRGAGAADAPPCLLISPNPLRFGAVRRGEERTLGAELISCGARPLNIAGLSRGQVFGLPLSDEFQLTLEPAWPQALAAGQRANVEVTYAPRLAGLDLGHFVVRNDSPEPVARLELQAQGLPPDLQDVDLHVQLEWSADDCDVDLHLLRPDAPLFDCDGDCFYQNPAPDWGAAGDFEDDPFLDVDNVEGLGPENINLQRPQPGVYRVVVHYYLDHFDGDEGPTGSTATDATVRIFVRGQLAHEATAALDHTDRTWDVADVDWPAGDIRPLNDQYEFDRAGIPACGGFFRP